MFGSDLQVIKPIVEYTAVYTHLATTLKVLNLVLSRILVLRSMRQLHSCHDGLNLEMLMLEYMQEY